MPMTIRQIAYELYKQYWIDTHTAHGERMEAKTRYCLDHSFDSGDEDDAETFEEWLENSNGYGGSLYACYDEFIVTEYQNTGFVIQKLFRSNVNLAEAYLKDINGESRVSELLNKLVAYELEGRTPKEVIELLLSLGFTPEELVGECYFNESDVAEVMQELSKSE